MQIGSKVKYEGREWTIVGINEESYVVPLS